MKRISMKTRTKSLIISAIILVILIFADAISTQIALRIPELEEGNPNSKRILDEYGLLGLFLSSFLLWIPVLIIPVIYFVSSRGLTYLANKDKKPKIYNSLEWFVFGVCFLILAASIIVRANTVATNVYLITVYS